jgi:DNA-binding beta-propeller fold protein YncE
MNRGPGWALVALLLVTGCAEDPAAPEPDPVPPEELPASPPRVLVVNGLSETLSSLDPGTGQMTVQAAVLGTWPNRVTATPDRLELLVTASGDNEIEVLAAHDLSRRGGVDVHPGSNPWLAVASSRSEAYATNWLSGGLRRLDLASHETGPLLRTTPGPEGFAVSDGHAWIACTNYREDGTFGPGRVDVADLAAWSVVASIPVGRNPQDVLVDAAGRVHVLCTGTYGGGPDDEAGSVHVVDRATRAVVGVVPLGGSPGRLALGEDGVVWVSGVAGGVRRYRADDLEILPDPTDRALTSSGLTGIAIDATTSTVWVASFDADLLMEVDPVSVTVSNAWIVGDGPVDVLVLRPDQRGAP